MTFLDPIFKPKSVAVIGATSRTGSIGNHIVRNIINYGFNGTLFPVNPKHAFIQSIKCYPSVLDIPDAVDLAVIVVSKEYVLEVADQCGVKGVKGLVIISAGFREVGGEGTERERKLSELQKKHGFRIIGPNCMGVLNADPDVRLNATFAPIQPTSGSLAFLTQSGALGVAILIAASKLNIGLSYFVSVGNKVDVSGNELLEYWGPDESAKVIALYLESFGEPRRFTQLSKQISKKKPVIMVKSGRTAAGALAASSHTGHLAGMENAVRALLRQCGVIRANSIDEMMDLALAFTVNPIPKGDRIAILTNAGGPAVMATDVLVGDLQQAAFTKKTKEKLAKLLPAEASLRNPVDMIAGAGAKEYEGALSVILEDEGVDAVIVIFVPPIMIEPRDIVRAVTEVKRRFDKPVFMVLMAEERYYEELPREFTDAPPIFRFPESAVNAVSAMNRYRLWRERPEGKTKTFDVDNDTAREIIEKSRASGGGYMSAKDVNRILEAYGFPVCRLKKIKVDEDPAPAAKDVGYPVVLKITGPDIIHKSDFGGVAVNIADEEMLAAAHKEMIDKLKRAKMMDRVDGFLVQEMAQSGKEVILGMATDPKFGPILMFGMGGKYVEIIKDIAFRVMPVTDVDAREMVENIKSYPLLEGVRGEERVDIEFVVEGIERLAQMVNDFPEIIELDMNPVVVTTDRATSRIVDARIRIE